MDIQAVALPSLFLALKGVGYEVSDVQCPGVTPPTGPPIHVAGENALQVSTENFELIANDSTNASMVPPNCVHIQVRGYALYGSKRTLQSPWLEVEAVQFWVRANQ